MSAQVLSVVINQYGVSRQVAGTRTCKQVSHASSLAIAIQKVIASTIVKLNDKHREQISSMSKCEISQKRFNFSALKIHLGAGHFDNNKIKNLKALLSELH